MEFQTTNKRLVNYLEKCSIFPIREDKGIYVFHYTVELGILIQEYNTDKTSNIKL